MAKIQARKIAAAITKAQQVGKVEEPVTISGCAIVLSSLTNPEYEKAMEAVSELEDVAYAVGFRVEHLCRSIVEINNESLREFDYVELDVEDAKTGDKDTLVLERAQFIRDYVLASWSREAIDTAFRKFNDVVARAEQVAAEGIVFSTKEETAEESYRRLLAEAKEIEGVVPFELATRIRDEFGYLLKQEWANLEAKATPISELGEEPLAKPPERQEASVSAPSTDLIMRRPVATQAPVQAPVPQPLPTIPPMGAPQVTGSGKRSVEIQELEAVTGLDQGEELGATPDTAYNPHRPVARDPAGLKSILDQPPVGGINPKFKKPT